MSIDMSKERSLVKGFVIDNCVECFYNDYDENEDKIYCTKDNIKEIPMVYDTTLKCNCVNGIPSWCTLKE